MEFVPLILIFGLPILAVLWVSLSKADQKTEPVKKKPIGYYVYVHKDSKGKIFYVGKGTGNRAWREDRHALWEKYVNEHLQGIYQVEILQDGLTEDDALELEWQLLLQHGETCVNWVNPGRRVDAEAAMQQRKLYDKKKQLKREGKALEPTDLKEASIKYKEALDVLREINQIQIEQSSLVSELSGDEKFGDIWILDRLTLCLIRIKNYEAAQAECESYFSEYPYHRSSTVGIKILKRIGKLEGVSNK